MPRSSRSSTSFGGRKKSWIWNCFKEVERGNEGAKTILFECKKCGRFLSMNRLRTDRLVNHQRNCKEENFVDASRSQFDCPLSSGSPPPSQNPLSSEGSSPSGNLLPFESSPPSCVNPSSVENSLPFEGLLSIGNLLSSSSTLEPTKSCSPCRSPDKAKIVKTKSSPHSSSLLRQSHEACHENSENENMKERHHYSQLGSIRGNFEASLSSQLKSILPSPSESSLRPKDFSPIQGAPPVTVSSPPRARGSSFSSSSPASTNNLYHLKRKTAQPGTVTQMIFKSKKKISQAGATSNSSVSSFVTRTTDKDRDRIRTAWAEVFYQYRLSFRLADSACFRNALETTRPGISNNHIGDKRPLLTRKMLSGKLLDEAEIKCKAMLRDQIKLKYVVLSQDGWSDTRNEPVVAASIHCEGSTYPLDFISVGASEKNAEFMALKAKESILRAEEEFGCVVVGFVSDSENKMVRCRKILSDWRESLIVYGCAAHALNLVEGKATSHQTLAKIVAIQKFFKNHHKAAALLKERKGKIPQLPNETRWTSQTETLKSFISNFEHYWVLADNPDAKVDSSIKTLLENWSLMIKARKLLEQLSTISMILNIFQDDHSTLSDTMRGWLYLQTIEDLAEDTKDAIKAQFAKTITPWHALAFMMDPRPRVDEKGNPWPVLPHELATAAREAVMTLDEDGSVALTKALTEYVLEDTTGYPKILFDDKFKRTMDPRKYWEYAKKICNPNSGGVWKFSDLMHRIFCLPPSSAGIERIFSTAGLVQSKLRNQLEVSKVGRLVLVSRLLLH